MSIKTFPQERFYRYKPLPKKCFISKDEEKDLVCILVKHKCQALPIIQNIFYLFITIGQLLRKITIC